MGYGWLGTFRQGQWQAYRHFVLNERRDVARRIAVIQAELTRIGEVSVSYASTKDANGTPQVTEQRTGFSVSRHSSLEKLVQAYIAQGGNPFDISLFLSPDSTYITNDTDEEGTPTQPHGGVVSTQSGAPSPGVRYDGGYLTVKKYLPSRQGGRGVVPDGTMASAVSVSRKWVNTTIQHRLHDLEARIIKLCDLREQLMQEMDSLTMAVGGTQGAIPTLDTDFHSEKLGVAQIIATIDGIFYPVDDTGKPDFTKSNTDKLEEYRSLLLDDPAGEEDNTAL